MNNAAAATADLETALAHASRLLATDPALAAEQAGEIIKAAGPHPMAVLVLGASHRARNQIDEALRVLQPLAQAQPKWAAAQFELGLASVAPAKATARCVPCVARSR